MKFKFATASVIGSTHQKLHYNNQDSYNFYQDENCIIGVVSDGCGSGACSEVGSKLAVDFVVNYCKKEFSQNLLDINTLQNAVIEFLHNIVKNQQTKDEEYFIKNYLLFTLFGFIIQKEQTYIFHSGDGFYILNDKEITIEQNNRPKYIANSLLNEDFSMSLEIIDTNEVEKILIATDGITHLNEKYLQGENIDGMNKISDLFNIEEYFENEVSLPKFLTDLSLKRNILKDDTTTIMIKR